MSALVTDADKAAIHRRFGSALATSLPVMLSTSASESEGSMASFTSPL